MEKPGMGRGYPRIRAGLLAFLLFAASFPGLFAVEGEGVLILSLESFPPEPRVGLPWMVSILVDHPYPAEVMVMPPALPAGLSLDRIRTRARVMKVSGERRTEVEFTFISGRKGPLLLPPFTVNVPGKRALSRELHVYVGDALDDTPDDPGGIRGYRFRLIWESLPPSLHTGEHGEIRLGLAEQDRRKPLPGPFSYYPPVPFNAILEELPLSAVDREGGVLLRLLVIPLEGDEVFFPARTLQYGTGVLEIPALSVPVLAAALPSDTALPAGTVSLREEPAPIAPPGMADRDSSVVPFPDISPGPFFPFRGAYEKALTPVRRFWEAGHRAEALALLRRNERDTLIGFALVPVRRAAEASLGLTFRRNEFFQGFPVIAIAALVLCSVALIFFFFRKKSGEKSVTSPIPRGYKIVFIILIPMLGLGIYGFYWGFGLPVKGRAAVLRETSLYRVPEHVTENSTGIGSPSRKVLAADSTGTSGRAEAGFAEGEPVLIRSAAGSWAYVESSDGRAGWVPAERLIPY
ncbi:MAG: hypothetical protein LBD78_06090 [Spirochaetaceae bacterium]|jgi:hypothetical protein|nr:hypothetical protein [Spirochaetaceae bacterium]